MKKGIIVDCERMKYPNTGLYHYCKELSIALCNQQQLSDVPVNFYVPFKEIGFLQKHVQYHRQQWWHKIINPISVKYEVWHCTYQGSNYFPNNDKVKKILTIHDLNILYDERKPAEKKKKHLKKIQEQINRSSCITAISQFTLNCVREHLDISAVPAEVIYNGCNLPRSNMLFTKPSFIPEGIPYIFSMGTIAVKKNFHVLPALLKGNDYLLVIAGITQDEGYLNKIIAEAKRHGVEDRLIIPGPVSEAEKYWLLQNMLAFVFPSVSEGFGLPVVEAMHFGKPLILSQLTSLPEIGNNAAYYFNSFEPEDMRRSLTQSLEHYYNHPDQSNIIKSRAAFFNWADSAKKYWSLYRKVLA